MNDNKMNPNARLTFLERFAYGIGDYAGNLVYSAISAFLLVYYTNVVGASAAAAASISAKLDGSPRISIFQKYLMVFQIWESDILLIIPIVNGEKPVHGSPDYVFRWLCVRF